MADFRRIASPPSDLTGPLGLYLREVARAINDIPQVSAFSATTPNSLVTGYPGDLAINLASASTDTRLWIKGGSSRQPSRTGWMTLRIGPA